MPYVDLPGSPMVPGRSPVPVFYRDTGSDVATSAVPLLVLHGGWGYEYYPFDAQIAAMPERRFVIPDRSGYGRSVPLDELPPRFHHAAAAEHEALLDALAIERCAIWGHSDGAVIAAIMALRRPSRIDAVVLEALHLDRRKPRSREFFEQMAHDPDGFGTRVAARLAADHGDRWRDVLRAGGRAWLAIAETPDDDFYEHRLGEIDVPTLVLHGADDPRTEPGELDRVSRELPDAALHWIAGGGHAPHSGRAVRAEATEVGARFLRRFAR